MRTFFFTSVSLALLAPSLGCGGGQAAGSVAQAPESAPAVETPPQAELEAEEWVPESVAKTSFELSVDAVRPGDTFLIAARFDIERGYRLGWLNPGDVGKATRVELKVPDGFTVSKPRYPAPQRYDLGHDLMSYGYKDLLAIFFEVKAPKKLNSSMVHRFEVNATWLGCKKECVSEETNAFFELTTNWRPSRIDFDPEIQAQLDKVPLRLRDLKNATHAWSTKNTVSVKAANTRWKDFFPASGKMRRASFQSNQLLVQYAENPHGQNDLGVARAEVAGKERFVSIPQAPN